MNGVSMSGSMAMLTITRTSLQMETFFGAIYHFERYEILRIRRRWRQLWPCLRIEHTSRKQPRDLWFIPWWRPAVIRDFVRLGYKVK